MRMNLGDPLRGNLYFLRGLDLSHRDIRNGIKVEIIDLLSWEEGMALANPCLSQVVL